MKCAGSNGKGSPKNKVRPEFVKRGSDQPFWTMIVWLACACPRWCAAVNHASQGPKPGIVVLQVCFLMCKWDFLAEVCLTACPWKWAVAVAPLEQDQNPNPIDVFFPEDVDTKSQHPIGAPPFDHHLKSTKSHWPCDQNLVVSTKRLQHLCLTSSWTNRIPLSLNVTPKLGVMLEHNHNCVWMFISE